MDAATGGAAGIDMLQHAVRAVAAGDARTSCSWPATSSTPGRSRTSWTTTTSPRASTSRRSRSAGRMRSSRCSRSATWRRTGSSAPTTGALVSRSAPGPPAIRGRLPHAADARGVSRRSARSDPLCLLDCVPVVAGADALIVSGAAAACGCGVRAAHNADGHDGDGLETGLRGLAGGSGTMRRRRRRDRRRLGVRRLPGDGADPARGPRLRRAEAALAAIETRALPREHVRRATLGRAGRRCRRHARARRDRRAVAGRAGERQVAGARLGVASGYGMVAYRHGACANAVVLEARERRRDQPLRRLRLAGHAAAPVVPRLRTATASRRSR